MIPSPNHQSRGNARVRLVVLHTSEGARDVTSLGRYLSNPAVEASYHAAFDDQRAEQYVDYSQAAWAVLSANNISDNGCCCGFAAWSVARYKAHRALSRFRVYNRVVQPRFHCGSVALSVEQWMSHPTMLELAAQWVAARCTMRRIPIRHLATAEVAACRADPNHPGGVIGHWDWTVGARDGTHTDPGVHFPWDWVINRARQIAGHQPKECAEMIHLPATAPPTDPASDPRTWLGRNFDVTWNVAGGWEGGAAFSFGVQDWSPKRADKARGFLLLASWIMPGGQLIPVDPLYTSGRGQTIETHTLTREYAAPTNCVGVTLNYSAPGGAHVALGRSG